jgi:hypothetical protein
VFLRSAKSRENPRAEEAKERIRHEIRRQLTDEEEHLIELSSPLLDSDDDQHEDDLPKAA